MKRSTTSTLETLDNLRRIFQAVNEYTREAERATGLTAHQLWALKILANAAPMRVSDLARAMHLRPPTVVGILDRLEARQLIQRSAAKHDRRVVELNPTPKAREIVAGAPEVAQDMLQKGLLELTDEQLECVEEGMKLMVRLLNAGHLTPQPLHS